MSPTRKMGIFVGVAALSLTAIAGDVASAQDDHRAEHRTATASDDVPVVHDAGLDERPTVDSTSSLQTCYGGERYWDAGLLDGTGDSHYIPGPDDNPDAWVGRVPVYVASERCNDVNIRVSTTDRPAELEARVCFFPYSAPRYCNQWTRIGAGNTDWLVIATSLINGTRFEIEFNEPGDYLEGYVAY